MKLLETLTRKACTFSSLVHSAVLIRQQGISPTSMGHRERLRYLELREALNWKHGLIVYDVGANVGDFASFVAKSPFVSAVYCFEPIPDVFDALTMETETNAKISCFRIGLADRSGHFLMNSNDFSPSSSMLSLARIHQEEFPLAKNIKTVEVQTMTMSEAVKQHGLAPPDFIKIDVQGFEDRVIRGGRDLVKKAKFCMLELSLVDLYEDSLLITEMNALMRSLGFRMVSIVHSIVGTSGEIVQIDGLYKNYNFH